MQLLPTDSTAADRQQRQPGWMPVRARQAVGGALLAALVMMFVLWLATSQQFTDRPSQQVHVHAGAPAVDGSSNNNSGIRRIVPSLTQELKQQLQKHDIGVLLVLPGQQALQSVSLKWDELSLAHPVEFIRNFEDFRGRPGWQPHTKVAVLTLAADGVVHSSQASLAAAMARRLRNSLVVSFAHNTHKDKPQTLVTFDSDGTPVALAVQESAVFRDAFTEIYAKKTWGADGGGSGLGSTLNYTANARQTLLGVLRRYNISSMLDSSCGSMHWMPLVLQEREKEQQGFRFMGTDVVCMLIDGHKATFAAHTNWGFKCIDYSAQPLPSGYQLVWSRDSLQHVPLHGAFQFLNNVKASGAEYLLVGSYLNSAEPNKDVPGGGYFPIDLLKPPFNASQPLEVFDEKSPDGKHLLLFEVAKMTWSDPLLGLV